MPRYVYDYSVAPTRPTGFRSILSNLVVITTIGAVSAISAALVTLDLLGPAPVRGDVTVKTAAAVPPITTTQVAAVPATQVATVPAPKLTPWTVYVRAPIEQSTVGAAGPATTASTSAQAQPQTAPALSQSQPVAEHELTFAHGYALRRAAARAAQNGASAVVQDASLPEVGRAPATVYTASRATSNRRSAQNSTAARRDFFGSFARSERDHFDFRSHQALAYGEQNGARHTYPQSPGGWFGGPSRGFGGLY